MKFANFLILIGFITAITSCKKAQLASVVASNDDAAIIVGNTLAANNYGMNVLSTDISANEIALMTKNLACGQSVTDSIIRKSSPGALASYYYKLKYTDLLTCNTSSQPDNLTNTLSYKGNFNGPRLTFTNSGTTNYKIAGLTPTATVHVFNGDYRASGSFKFKSDTTNRGNVSLMLIVKNLTISKATQTITGGTATVIITGTSTKKSAFTYNGTLNFNNAFSASLSLNGIDYIIDLITGEISKK
ncbi:MAG: hypothetical protein ABI367_13875 [Mucilaginibacter sp.]